jgi:hypothetical protein
VKNLKNFWDVYFREEEHVIDKELKEIESCFAFRLFDQALDLVKVVVFRL